jgi:hypothetical protein
MNYNVLIKQCRIPRRAAAEEFEAIGAEVDFVSIPTAQALESGDDGDDSDDISGRILSEIEFMERLKWRTDIFTIEKDDRLRKIEAACLMAGIASGIWMTKHDVATVIGPEFYEKGSQQYTVTVIGPQSIPGAVRPIRPEPTKKPVTPPPSGVKTIEKGRSTGTGGKTGGGGDPLGRITKMGVLGLIADKVAGKPIASADIFGRGGFASAIDAIIAGQNGLKQGGGAGAGRKGESGIGYGIGINSGLGGEGIDDIMGSLLPTAAEIELVRPLHKATDLVLRQALPVPGTGVVAGGRSRASIMRVVMQNLAAIRYAYNKRLREKPGLKGKITCKFAVDEFGRVILCEMTGSTVVDPLLEAEVVAKIKSWVFEKIDKPGDVTEVVYPFAFSQ